MNQKKSKIKYLLVSGALLLSMFTVNKAYADLAVLNSADTSVESRTLYSNITEILKNTNIKYGIISDADLKTLNPAEKEVLLLPYISSFDEQSLDKIIKYVNKGGKIIMIYPGETVSLMDITLAQAIGVNLEPAEKLEKNYVNWLDEKIGQNNFFESSVPKAVIKLAPSSQSLAVWDHQEENFSAVTISSKGSYIGWRFGVDGDKDFNSKIITKLVGVLEPSLISDNPILINLQDFNSRQQEISKFQKNAQYYLESLQRIDSNIPLAEIQEDIYMAKSHQDMAKSYYKDENYSKAIGELDNAQKNSLSAYAKSLPSSIVEGRTLWLDRGTIVKVKSQSEMAELFDKIKSTGINLVYFETINAGYPVYPSTIIQQNPLTKGIDPLKWAVEEAHKRDIELHAWAWIFAVGNTKHNPIIDQSENYAGPILQKDFSLALIGTQGNLIPKNQSEYWIDPANPKARELMLSLLEEIVSNYDVDGIQLDYIRYPFQSPTNLMGLDLAGRQNFEIQMGYTVEESINTSYATLNNWKTEQVNQFVKQTSERLRKIKPEILISAAVFGGTRQKRIASIQQDWETWIENGWVDILNPMIYSTNLKQLAENIEYFTKTVENKVLVYPGISVQKLNELDIIEQVSAVKDAGLIGNTIFAMAHLSNEKSAILSNGPYKNKSARNPNKEPLKSASLLMDDFLRKLNNIQQNNPNNESLLLSEIISNTRNINAYLLSCSSGSNTLNIGKAIPMLYKLESLAQDWLTSEKNINSYATKQIIGDLADARKLLIYLNHKNNAKSVASK